MMMRDERRMGAQLTNLEQGETGCASRLSRALLCRRLGAALLLPTPLPLLPCGSPPGTGALPLTPTSPSSPPRPRTA